MFYFFKTKKAFTLVEMLIVVAVIGILSSVLLTSLEPARLKAKDAKIIQEVNQVRNIAEILYDGDYDALEEVNENTTIINNKELKILYDDIKKFGGQLVIRKSSLKNAKNFVAYSRLNILIGEEPNLKVNYYCVDNKGRAVFTVNEPQNAECPD